jgi:hypothetical protein
MQLGMQERLRRRKQTDSRLRSEQPFQAGTDEQGLRSQRYVGSLGPRSLGYVDKITKETMSRSFNPCGRSSASHARGREYSHDLRSDIISKFLNRTDYTSCSISTSTNHHPRPCSPSGTHPPSSSNPSNCQHNSSRSYNPPPGPPDRP